MLLSSFYGTDLRRAVAGKVKVVRGAVKHMHAAEFDSDHVGKEGGRAQCGISKRVKAVALWILSAKQSYLALQEWYVPESMKGNLGLFWTAL